MQGDDKGTIRNVDQLEEMLSEPTQGVIDALGRIDGDILILGVGGKMGPTLARMAKRAVGDRRVIGVDIFPNAEMQSRIESFGIETIKCNLLDPDQLNGLPDAKNVVFMVGMKFGSTGQEALTWAMNAFLPGMVALKYRNSRIVVFSTGNIYGLAPVLRGGSVETDTLNPIGDYATSALGRERIFEHFSRTYGIPTTIIRLNYAIDMRYGVLFDIAQKVLAGETIDVTMGNANVIWQGDANAMILQSFSVAATPPFVAERRRPRVAQHPSGRRAVRRDHGQAGRTRGMRVPGRHPQQRATRPQAVRLPESPRPPDDGLDRRLGDVRRREPREADTFRKSRWEVLGEWGMVDGLWLMGSGSHQPSTINHPPFPRR